MSGKPECEDGRMGSHGARAESLVAFSHTGRWKAREVVAGLFSPQCEVEALERRQIVDEAVMKTWIWMAMDQTDIDTNQMG
jgi:hypothetical protein